MPTDWFSEVTGAKPTPPAVAELAARDLGPPLSEREAELRSSIADARANVTPARSEERADWWSEVNSDMQTADAYYSGRMGGGTYETAHGGPQVPALRDAPETAGLVTSLRTGMIENKDARIRALAEQRFPGQKDAWKRYGLVDGQIVFRGDDGSLYREQDGWDRFASGVGEAGPAFLGAAGGTVIGGPVGAGIGGMFGEAMKKIGGSVQGDDQTVAGNAADIGIEGALSWAGAKVGDVIGKHVVDRRVVRDLPRFNQAETRRLMKLAQARGVILTPAEASNLGSLIQRQSMLGMGADEAGDLMRDFYGKRATKLMGVIDDFIGQTPPADVSGGAAREVGKGIIDDAVAARETATRASYRLLDKANPKIPQKTFAALDADDLTRGYIDKAVSDPKFGVMDQPRNSYRVIDRVGKLMRDEVTALKKAGRKYEAGLVEGKRQSLLKTMEQQVPGYRDTRRVFADQSKPIEAAEQGIEGVLARLKDTKLRKAADTLLSPANVSPDDVMKARRLFENQGRMKDWDALVNQRLRDVFERQKTTLAQGDATIGPKFRLAVFGSQRDRDILKAAMGSKRFQGLEELMDVLEAIGRVPKQQSITHFAGEASKQEARSAAPVSTFLRNLKISDPGGEFLDMITDRSVEKWRGLMARVVTSPDALKELEKLRVLKGLSPTSRAKLRVTTLALQKAGVLAGESALSERPTRLPPPKPEP